MKLRLKGELLVTLLVLIMVRVELAYTIELKLSELTAEGNPIVKLTPAGR
jgi:hypothetical protein